MTSVQIPTPPELDHAPELAVLAALEAALLAAEYAVIAGQPLLRDPGGDAQPSRLHWVALDIVHLAASLQHAIWAYRRTLHPLRTHCDDIPF